MITKRIIPCLDVKDGRVVKGVNFAGLQDMADPVEMARYYNASGADELVFYDITASVEGRGLFTDILREVASQIFIPLTVGGGINVYNSRNVVLRDVAANAEGSYYAIWCDEGAFVTVESGSYSSKGAGVVGITASAPSDLTVNGGEFVTAGENTPLVLPGYRDPPDQRWNVRYS